MAEEFTDGELLDAVRAGDSEAYGTLFARHRAPALRVARRLTPDAGLAEDAVNEAFASVLSAIRGGAGPVGVFGPYLISSVSRAVYRMNRRSMQEAPVADTEILDRRIPDASTVVAGFDNAAARSAYKHLPDRWREVVWYLDIEEMPPRQAAPLLGLSPNATVALHRRAKEALRLEYLREHVKLDGPEECQKRTADIPAYVLRTLRKSRTQALEDHLDTCERCKETLQQIQDVIPVPGTRLPSRHALVLQHALCLTRRD